MSFKNIILNNPSYLTIKAHNLHIYLHHTQQECTIALNDIAIILLDHSQITLTKEVLTQCHNYNIAIITTNSSHLPCGIFLSYYNYYHTTSIINLQTSVKTTTKNNLWKKLVVNKIHNQASVLAKLNKPIAKQLTNLATKVVPNDANNYEAQAARLYFMHLFHEKTPPQSTSDSLTTFTRSGDHGYNLMLNYGYALIRSSLAKALSAKGFHCSLGIHHCSSLNNFNLADDLIEPFRPFIDYHVAIANFPNITALTKEHKEYLLSLLNYHVFCTKGEVSILTACDMLVDSLLRCYKESSAKLLLKITLFNN